MSEKRPCYLSDQLSVRNKLYPRVRPFRDDTVKRISHEGNRWVFLRGEYGSMFEGFLITTSDDGTITDVKYSKRIK